MTNVGYARVSTDEQTTEGQIDALRAAGCTVVYTENASGGNANRPELAKALASLKKGDTFIVVRIDRLARSLSHLLSVIETLDRRGAGFRSLGDPIDTTSPQGRFTLQILGSVAEFERALIRERTVSGMQVAAKNGSRAGNPGLISGDPEALARISQSRDRARDDAVLAAADDLAPMIAALRPAATWKEAVAALNARGSVHPVSGARWGANALLRVSRRLVRAGKLDARVLDRTPDRKSGTQDNLLRIVSGLLSMTPDSSLDRIGTALQAMGQVTPRGSSRWSRSSVKCLLDQAKKRGMVREEHPEA